MAEPLWQPSPEAIEATRLAALMRRLERRHGIALPDYAALHAWSLAHPEAFWTQLWDDADIIAERRGERVLERPDAMPGFTGAWPPWPRRYKSSAWAPATASPASCPTASMR